MPTSSAFSRGPELDRWDISCSSHIPTGRSLTRHRGPGSAVHTNSVGCARSRCGTAELTALMFGPPANYSRFSAQCKASPSWANFVRNRPMSLQLRAKLGPRQKVSKVGPTREKLVEFGPSSAEAVLSLSASAKTWRKSGQVRRNRRNWSKPSKTLSKSGQVQPNSPEHNQVQAAIDRCGSCSAEVEPKSPKVDRNRTMPWPKRVKFGRDPQVVHPREGQ